MRNGTALLAGTILSLALVPLAPAQLTDPIPAKIPKGDIRINLQPAGTGFTAPTYLTGAGDNSGRLFTVDQTGKISIIQNGAVQSTPFLDISSTLAQIANPPPQAPGIKPGYDERGLLGLAFSPGFSDPASSGYRTLYTYQSEPSKGKADFTPPAAYLTNPTFPIDHQDVITQWRVSATNPNAVDPASRRDLLRIDHPALNHDGGTIAFGPDKMLYLGIGDGGTANDSGNGHNPAPGGNAQDTSIILGKMLRIDPTGNNSANGQYGIPADNPFASGTGGLKEIYATGLRNPFRYSFDKPTGRLIVADVGQNNIEEIDDVKKGQNYGWPFKEGTFKFNRADGTVSADTTGLPAGLTDPLAQYDHDEGIAVIGGFIYYGAAIPQLQGKYVFGDLSTSFGKAGGRLFYTDLADGQIKEFLIGPTDLPLGQYIKGMGQDDAGELYLLTSGIVGPTGTTGEVLQITAVPEPAGLLLVAAAIPLMLRRRARL